MLEKVTNDVYKANQDFVVAFDKLIALHKAYFDAKKREERVTEVVLFLLLFGLLIYLFTQLKDILLFIQTFLDTSKKIMQRASVQGIAPIESEVKSEDVAHALHDFNFFVENINRSIEYSALSIEKSVSSLEDIEKNIQNLLELIEKMDVDASFDKELIQKEDILIESLDELTATAKKLQRLQTRINSFKNLT